MRSPLLKAFRHKGIFIQRFIFILEGNRLLELTHVIRSMKREGKHGGLMRRRLRIKTTPFRLSSAVFQYSSLSFPYLTCPTIACKFFILAKKISRSADRRCIFFFEFSYVSKVILLLILALKGKFQILVLDFSNLRR